METRANHILIGTFVLIVIFAVFAFLIWLARIEIEQERAYYYVYFEESVAGLGLGGSVRFNGIPIGSVSEIIIDPDNPARVRVLVDVQSGVPIRTDTVAALGFQGITGVSFVQLTGGEPDKPLLRPTREDEIPVIPSVPSTLQKLFAGAPELLDQVGILVGRVTLLVSDENLSRFESILANVDDITADFKARGPQIESILANVDEVTANLKARGPQLESILANVDDITANLKAQAPRIDSILANVDDVTANLKAQGPRIDNILANVDDVTANLKAQAPRIDSILANVDDVSASFKEQAPQIENILQNVGEMSTDLAEAARGVNAMIGKVEGVLDNADAALAAARNTMTTADKLLDQDVRALVDDLRTTSQSITTLTRRLDGFLERNSEPLDVFASQGLIEFTKFIEEARVLVASTERLLENLSADPAQFLFGRQKGGVEPK